MRGVRRLAPTRMNLLRARRQLERVERGVRLLRRKREALVMELFRLARPAIDTRTLIARQFREAYPVLWHALAIHGYGGLRALAWPQRELGVELEPGRIWGIPVSDIVRRPPVRRTLEARGTAPAGTALLPAAEAATHFETLADLLLEAAPRELRIRRLGDALAQTSRQVHTLEQRLGPALVTQIVVIRRTLDEREREEGLRLRHLQRRRDDGRGAFRHGAVAF